MGRFFDEDISRLNANKTANAGYMGAASLIVLFALPMLGDGSDQEMRQKHGAWRVKDTREMVRFAVNQTPSANQFSPSSASLSVDCPELKIQWENAYSMIGHLNPQMQSAITEHVKLLLETKALDVSFPLKTENLEAFTEFMAIQNTLPQPEGGFSQGEDFTLHAECA